MKSDGEPQRLQLQTCTSFPRSLPPQMYCNLLMPITAISFSIIACGYTDGLGWWWFMKEPFHFLGSGLGFSMVERLGLRVSTERSMPHMYMYIHIFVPGPPKRSPFSACAYKLPQRSTLPLKSECAYIFKRRPPLRVFACLHLFECRSEIVKRLDFGRCLGVKVHM